MCEGGLETRKEVMRGTALRWRAFLHAQGAIESIDVFLNWETELNHHNSLGIWLNPAEWHCEMKITH